MLDLPGAAMLSSTEWPSLTASNHDAAMTKSKAAADKWVCAQARAQAAVQATQYDKLQAQMQNTDDALAASPLQLLDDDTFRTMCALLLPPMFIPSASFQGARPGYAFKLSHGRLGYHVDHVSSSLVAVALGRLGLTCRALLARTAPHALTMRLRRSMVDLALPVSSADKAPSVADIANAEAALHALREAGAQYPGDVEEATKQLAAAREWRRKDGRVGAYSARAGMVVRELSDMSDMST